MAPSAKKSSCVIALDCGTTGNRAIAFDRDLRIIANHYAEFTQYYPKPSWVEHDAEEIWKSTLNVLQKTLKVAGVSRVSSIGITNQRETLVFWDKRTGKPVMPAIVWQCRRTTDICADLKKKGWEPKIHRKTGVFLDPYFSGSKILWAVRHNRRVASGLKNGSVLWGTIDTWILWKLTGGKAYSTDPTNASRTLLYDIHRGKWDAELCRLFQAPVKFMPDVVPCAQVRGYTDMKLAGERIAIAGVAGDQQAAAFAQGCSPSGIVKNTYGTGLFVVADTGHKAKITDKLVTTVAASETPKLRYALEGSVFIGGAAMQWLRDGLQIIEKAGDSEKLIRTLPSNEGVYFVPALAGLGCPHWDPNARGLIMGLTRQTTRKHLIRATLESMAYQTKDVLDLVEKEIGMKVKELRVDGGAVKNAWLMQFQADMLGCKVERPSVTETTALGAAALAGIATGIWKNQKDFLRKMKIEKVFTPKMSAVERQKNYAGWQAAVRKTLL